MRDLALQPPLITRGYKDNLAKGLHNSTRPNSCKRPILVRLVSNVTVISRLYGTKYATLCPHRYIGWLIPSVSME